MPETGCCRRRMQECGAAPLSSRERILAAAVQVALREGVSAMTLEAVAREAGVSKGGLLYHFASKDELIAAMLAAPCRRGFRRRSRRGWPRTRTRAGGGSARWFRRSTAARGATRCCRRCLGS